MENDKLHTLGPDDEACNCNDEACNCNDEACDCNQDGADSCGCGHDHDHDHDHGEEGSALITIVDEETGEEYTFEMVDSIEFEGETYCLLATVDEEPEAVFVKVVTADDGSESLMSLDDDEFDRVAAAYDSMIDDDEEDEDDGDEPEEEPDETENH